MTSKCPYDNQPQNAFFKYMAKDSENCFVSNKGVIELDDNASVMSFGSCFASRVSSLLSEMNFLYLKDENKHASVGDDLRILKENDFSLPTGNIYTAKHLKQFLERASGVNQNLPRPLIDNDGWYRNSFRPTMRSYKTIEALRYDDHFLFDSFAKLIKQCNLFVFTIGLTEQWLDSENSLVLPQVPGCGLDRFVDGQFIFIDQDLDEIISDLEDSIRILKQFNPNIKILFTVSPVPLLATYKDVSVIQASFQAKAKLIEAVSKILNSNKFQDLFYFPSFEIVMNPLQVSQNFINGRDISDRAISLVKSELNQFFGKDASNSADVTINAVKNKDFGITLNLSGNHEVTSSIICDEEDFYSNLLKNKFND